MNKQIKVLIKKYSCKSFILQHFSSMLGCSLKLNASPSRPSHTFALAFAQYNGTVSHLARAQRSCLRTSHTSALEPFAELSFAHWLSGAQSRYVSLGSRGVRTAGCSLKLNASPSRPSHTFALAFACLVRPANYNSLGSGCAIISRLFYNYTTKN